MNLISLLVVLIILALVFWAVVWLIDWIGLPEPFNKIIKALVGIVFIVYLLSVLLGVAAMPPLLHLGRM